MIYADLHAHPFLCAFQRREHDDQAMSRNPNDEYSVWHLFPVEHNLVYTLGQALGFTTYSESDFTQSVTCGVKLLGVSLYPPERGFFQLDDTTFFDKLLKWIGLEKFTETELGSLISGFSVQNIAHIKSPAYSYFTELQQQAGFVKNTVPYTPDLAGCVGTVYSNIQKASYVLRDSSAALSASPTSEEIQVVLNVEGGNSLWGNFTVGGQLWNGTNFSGYFTDAAVQGYTALSTPDFRNDITPAMVAGNPAAINTLLPQEICTLLLDNLRTFIGSVRIFSFTLAHHFYNGLCGHCASLQPLTDYKLVNQSFGLGSDLTNAGYTVVDELLKNKIIVDVKHMSLKARQSFYRYRANHYPAVPIVASHAAVNGLKLEGGGGNPLHTGPLNPFYPVELNLYDDDVYEIARSGGLIGVLMDQRVNGVKNSDDGSVNVQTIWQQFRYIAERAAEAGLTGTATAWDCMCLGTDFDGVIHPVDEFNTYSALINNDFAGFLLQNIKAYLQTGFNLRQQDKLEPEEILSKICFRNMNDFVGKYYV